MTAPRPTGSVRRRAHAAGLPAPLPPIWRRTHPLPPASAEPLEPRKLLATFTVTTTADAGPGSLRQAILDANAAPDADQITFAIPSPVDAIQTIRPLSALPDVTGTTTILAPTQSGTVRGPKVQLDGSAAGPAADGLTIRGANSIVSGLSVFDFAGNGIVVRDGTGTRVSSCYVGFSAAFVNDPDQGNGGAGVLVSTSGVTVGGTGESSGSVGNVISGNRGQGVRVTNVSAGQPVRIAGNTIGLVPEGDQARPNTGDGVDVNNSVGTVLEFNTISGNIGAGVRLESGATGTRVLGNKIGTDTAGRSAVGNWQTGVTSAANDVVIGENSALHRNVISSNKAGGVLVIGGMGPRIQGNYVGTDVTGAHLVGRQPIGVQVGGGLAAQIRNGNVIAGSGGSGVAVVGSFVASPDVASAIVIDGNFIGVDVTGAVPLGNGRLAEAAGGGGVTVNATGTAGISLSNNVIADSGGDGIDVGGTARVSISRNRVGTNAAGNAALPNRENGITVTGGRLTVQSNLVSGNEGSGIRLGPATAQPDSGLADLWGNRIGTNLDGAAALPNGGAGIEVWYASGTVQIGSDIPPPSTLGFDRSGNLISGNRGHGVIVMSSRGVQLLGNYIGTTLDGAGRLGNGGSGIYAAGSFVQVGGGNDPGRNRWNGNVVSGNSGNGITLTDALGAQPPRALVEGNTIGTNAARSLDGPGLGNGGHGVVIVNASGNEVGGLPGAFSRTPNVIAFNAGSGVVVEQTAAVTGAAASVGNAVAGNVFFANGILGIDLAADGPTPNDPGDADEGPNRLLNYPVIEQAVARLTSTDLRFSFEGRPNTVLDLHFFQCSPPNATGRGQGTRYLGTVRVTTDGGGHAAGTLVTGRMPANAYVTALAVLPGSGFSEPQDGSTSEFSPAVKPVRARPIYRPQVRPGEPVPAARVPSVTGRARRRPPSLGDLLDRSAYDLMSS